MPSRSFARSSAPPPSEETPEDKARTFIISLGYEAEVAQGIITAIAGSGMRGSQLLTMVRTLAGRYEIGEDAGLEDLAMSVRLELERSKGRRSVNFLCLPPDAWIPAKGQKSDSSPGAGPQTQADIDMMKRAFSVEALEGMSLTDVAKHGDGEGSSTLAEYIECACSGIMACSTCHVVVDPAWFERVGPPDEDEQDMIDLAFDPTPTSRLGCQIVLTADLDGLVLRLPRGANNIMDNIPFEDQR